MGYYMEQVDCKFKVLAEDKPKALAAIKELADHKEQMSGGSWSGGKQTGWHFSWVSTETFLAAPYFENAMEAWRWECETDLKTGDVVSIHFSGQKLGDEDKLFAAIAPFVESGSFIEMSGEDGERWRWVFSEGKVRELAGKIVWEE